jgi:hypothetical protein
MFASRPTGVRTFRYGWTAFLVCATSFPYLLSFLSAPTGYRYTWILPPYPEDSLGYLSWSEQAARGALLFKVKYTALPQHAFLFHPFFLVCGWAGRLFPIDLGLIHLIAKEVGVVLFFLVFYKYTDYLELTDFQTVVASILVGISSGFGGVLAFMGLADRLPFKLADLWVPELSTYWSLLWNPLFPYSLLLMLLVVFQIDRGSKFKRKRDMWIAGLTAGVLALVHPYSQPLLLAFAVIVIAVRVRKQWLSYLIRYCLPLFPFDLYLLLLSKFQPVVSQHNLRGGMASPPVLALLAGFGLPLLIFLLGLTVERALWLKKYWQVGLWFLLCFSCSYLPFWFQRKLILGAHIPLCILAAVSFDLILSRISPPSRRKLTATVAAIALIPVLVATPVYLLQTERADVQDNNKGAYFLSDDVANGMKYLKNHADPEELVLASIATSRFIPAYSGNRVLWGHWAMSVDFEQRKNWYKTLFNKNQNWYDEQRSNVFWSSGIVYVFADQDIKKSIEDSPWEWDVILRHSDKVFQNATVTIYKRNADAATQ